MKEHYQGVGGCAVNDLGAATGEMQALACDDITHFGGHPHSTHRFVGRSTARTCHATCRHSTMGVTYSASTINHLLHHGLAHRSTCVENRVVNSQYSVLHVVTIAHYTAHKVVAATCNLGNHMGNVAACATLGSR